MRNFLWKLKRYSTKKSENFAQIQAILNNAFKAILIQKSSRIKAYNTLTLPILLYGSENLPHRKKDKNDWSQSRWNFSKEQRNTQFDYKRNEEIFEDLKVAPFNGKLRGYKSHWLWHVTRMNNRMQKVMLNYRTNGRRWLGKPLKRLFRRGRISFIKT